jgi:hypothetical protein
MILCLVCLIPLLSNIICRPFSNYWIILCSPSYDSYQPLGGRYLGIALGIYYKRLWSRLLINRFRCKIVADRSQNATFCQCHEELCTSLVHGASWTHSERLLLYCSSSSFLCYFCFGRKILPSSKGYWYLWLLGYVHYWTHNQIYSRL